MSFADFIYEMARRIKAGHPIEQSLYEVVLLADQAISKQYKDQSTPDEEIPF